MRIRVPFFICARNEELNIHNEFLPGSSFALTPLHKQKQFFSLGTTLVENNIKKCRMEDPPVENKCSNRVH